MGDLILGADFRSNRLQSALTVGRDCVIESFDYVKNKDDQMLADARLLDIDQALALFVDTAPCEMNMDEPA